MAPTTQNQGWPADEMDLLHDLRFNGFPWAIDQTALHNFGQFGPPSFNVHKWSLSWKLDVTKRSRFNVPPSYLHGTRCE